MKKFFYLLSALVLLTCVVPKAFSQTNETFEPSGKLSMQFFSDYYYQIGADTIAKRGSQYYSSNARDYQAFDIRRVYLGYDYNLTRDISTQLLLAHENGAPSAGDVVLDANRGIYIKAANIKFKGWVPNASVIFGQQSTYAFALPESMWGYRSIEKTVMDARGLATSNDLGVAIAGSFDYDQTFGYSAMISNGNGAKAESDRYKKLAAELNAKLFDKMLAVDLYVDEMALSPSVDRKTISVFAGATLNPVTVGVQYAMQMVDTMDHGSMTPNAISAFVRATLMERKLSAFARYDIWNPNSKTETAYKENFITAGLDWMPDGTVNVHVMPNVWINSYGAQGSLPERKADVVGRLTMFYKF